MENRIKERFHLFADRVCAATIRANQFRLYLPAYVLVSGLRRLGLKATELAPATTIRLRLFKIGALALPRLQLSLAISVSSDLQLRC